MRDLPDISARGRQLLEYIARYVEDNKRPPTRREMMQELRLRSPQTADYHLTKLVESGYVDRTPHAHRGIELTDKGASASSVGTLPIIGQITAGDPILAQEEYSGDLAVGDYLSRVANFVLQVRGDSMVGADILDGDYVLIRRQPVAEPGQIVAALIIDGSETEATVKGHYSRGGRGRASAGGRGSRADHHDAGVRAAVAGPRDCGRAVEAWGGDAGRAFARVIPQMKREDMDGR